MTDSVEKSWGYLTHHGDKIPSAVPLHAVLVMPAIGRCAICGDEVRLVSANKLDCILFDCTLCNPCFDEIWDSLR